jgi:hypothetical protein
MTDLNESFLHTMSLPYLNEYFTSQCPASAPFFSFMGAAIALVFASESFLFCFPQVCRANVDHFTFFSDLGAAYGTAKAGVGIMTMGVLEPKLIIKSVIPVVMAGKFEIAVITNDARFYGSFLL